MTLNIFAAKKKLPKLEYDPKSSRVTYYTFIAIYLRCIQVYFILSSGKMYINTKPMPSKRRFSTGKSIIQSWLLTMSQCWTSMNNVEISGGSLRADLTNG